MAEIRWGIIGVGNIARKFAGDFPLVPGARLAAVASRSATRAQAFAGEFKADRCYASYEELVAQPDLDVVYVATRNSAHLEAARLCLEAGKAVVCEKPFTLNSLEARLLIDLARRQRVFLMEGMWTRCFPLVARARELIARGAIGAPRMIQADFGFVGQAAHHHQRLFDPVLGGGALLDVGVYTVSLASMVFGMPNRIASLAHIGATGVDEQVGIILSYAQGQLAMLAAAMRTDTAKEACIYGSTGSIKFHCPFWKPSVITLVCEGKAPEVVSEPFRGHGFHFEISEVTRCLNAGLLESPLMPLDETLAIMQTLDDIRAQWAVSGAKA